MARFKNENDHGEPTTATPLENVEKPVVKEKEKPTIAKDVIAFWKPGILAIRSGLQSAGNAARSVAAAIIGEVIGASCEPLAKTGAALKVGTGRTLGDDDRSEKRFSGVFGAWRSVLDIVPMTDAERKNAAQLVRDRIHAFAAGNPVIQAEMEMLGYKPKKAKGATTTPPVTVTEEAGNEIGRASCRERV